MPIFILIFMIGDLPKPTVMFLDTFKDVKECKAAIADTKSEEMRARVACIQLVPLATKET
jgi:hypothetical protein